MSLEIQFNPVISVWLIILLGLTGAVLSYLSYQKTQKSKAIWTALGLRLVTVILLILMLLNPVFFILEEIPLKPQLGILVDQSESLTIKNGRYQGVESFLNVMSEIQDIDTSLVSVKIFTFGSEFKQASLNTKWSLTQNETLLYDALANLTNPEFEINEILLITDGNQTSGNDPIYLLNQLDQPIHVIALGDTLQMKDYKISGVILPKRLQENVPSQVVVAIQAEALTENKNIRLQVLKNGKPIEKKSILLRLNQPQVLDTLQITSEKEGSDRWEIQLEAQADELITQNNRIAFTTQTINPSTTILHLAFGIHPDVKTVKSVLLEAENVRLKSYTWMGNNQFIEGMPTLNPDSIQGIILQGFSREFPSKEWIEKIEAIRTKVPILFLPLPGVRSEYPESIQEVIPYGLMPGLPSFTQAEFRVNEKEMNHPIVQSLNQHAMGLFSGDYQITTAQFPKANSRVLVEGKDPIFQRSYPAVVIRQQGSTRYAQWLFTNFYQIYQRGETSQQNLKKLLIQTLQWMLASSSDDLLEVTIPDRNFRETERIPIQATLKDESGQPVSDAIVDVTLTLHDSLITRFTLPPVSSGMYAVEVGPFAEGIYEINTLATIAGDQVDTDKKTLTISSTSDEFRQIKRNQQQLINLSSLSGGIFADFEDAPSKLKEIIQHLSETSQSKTIQKTIALIDMWWFLLLILTLLTMEWGLRKWKALP